MSNSSVVRLKRVNTSAPAITAAIYGRRSIRRYADRPIAQHVLKQLLDAAVQAPSAMNEQPWHFTVITDGALLDRMARNAKVYLLNTLKSESHAEHAKHVLNDGEFHIFYHAPALIVISAPSASPWAIENCALAAQNLMLMAYGLGLGTCWIGFAQNWLATPEGRAAIGLSEGLLPVAPIIVGHPAAIAPPVLHKEPNCRWIK